MKGPSFTLIGIWIVVAVVCYELIAAMNQLSPRVIFCDVGQGDAILVTSGMTQILVDGGPDNKVMDCLAHYLPWWDRQLELVVATHPDADHITGLQTVLRTYHVRSFLATHLFKHTTQFQQLLEEIGTAQRSGTVWLTPQLNQLLVIDSHITGRVLWPLSDLDTEGQNSQEEAEIHLSAYFEGKLVNINSYNDGSIALLISFDDQTVLLTGDLEQGMEKALIDSGLMNHTNILKAGHHGSKSSSSPALITKLAPEFSVISAGLKNKYGHPAPEVISRLEKAGSQIFKTAQVGSIVFRYRNHHLEAPQ